MGEPHGSGRPGLTEPPVTAEPAWDGRYTRLSGRVLRCVIATAEDAGTMRADAIREVTAALRALAPPDASGPGTAGQVGAVLLAGDGPNFCTGGNVRAFASASDVGSLVERMADELHALARALSAAPVPVVAAVNGWAAGAGMSIACLADVIVGGPSTRFRAAYPGIGFTPDGGMSYTLGRAIGFARARDLILTNSVLGGEDALRAGLLTRLVDDERVETEAAAVAAALADGPTGSYARLRRLLWDGAAAPSLEAHLDAEAASIAACAVSPDGREGVRAFVERRPPSFR